MLVVLFLTFNYIIVFSTSVPKGGVHTMTVLYYVMTNIVCPIIVGYVLYVLTIEHKR